MYPLPVDIPDTEAGELACDTPDTATLVAYRFVWTRRDRNGDWEYAYDWHMSDGTIVRRPSLPWGRLNGVVELPQEGNTINGKYCPFPTDMQVA